MSLDGFVRRWEVPLQAALRSRVVTGCPEKFGLLERKVTGWGETQVNLTLFYVTPQSLGCFHHFQNQAKLVLKAASVKQIARVSHFDLEVECVRYE
jgi:hypothetical protein